VRRAASLVALVCLLLAQGCPDGPSSASREKTRTLRVFAAASLSAPLDEIARAFEARNAGVRVLVNAASSSALERQLENGASCDLLIAATRAPVDRLAKAALLDPASVTVIASNTLVVIVRKGEAKPTDLAGVVGLGKIAVGARGVPVGDYARDAIEHAGLSEKLTPLLSSYPDEPSVVTATAEGGAPVGIVYASSTVAHPERDAIERAFAIDAKLHSEIVYVAAVTRGSSDPGLARAFISFLASDGKEPLRRAGFGL